MKKCSLPFIVLSAPSGTGKTTIARRLVKRNMNLKISVSATTRPRRPREVEGVDYYFLSEKEFDRKLESGKFFEFETVHGFRYGTLLAVLDKMIAEHKQPVFDIDVKGALAIKKLCPDSILIFIKPPSLEELKRRLENRKSENGQAITRRLSRIEYEFSLADKFDHVVVNDDLAKTVREIEAIIKKK